MEENEMLEQTNETENIETLTTEENVEGIELTDTAETPAQEEVRKSLKELLKENQEYQEEFNKMIQGRLDRKEREYQRELSRYKDTEAVLKTTIGGDDIEQINSNLRSLYEKEGVELPKKYEPGLSERQVQLLAKDEAETIIADGYDAMVEEANRLAKKKYENMNAQEKVIFTTLAEEITRQNETKELLSIGASEELLKDTEFNKFRSQFNSNTSVKDIYNLYKQTSGSRTVETPGSMKGAKTQETKTFYTEEEISKLTLEDLDKPGVFERVRESMTRNNNNN